MVLDFDILMWLISSVILGLILGSLRQRHNLSYLFCFSVFWVYLMFALRETIFPIPLTRDVYAPVPLQNRLNIIPFYFGPFSNFREAFLTSFLNILLTVPFGFGVSFVAKVKGRDFLWLAFVPGLLVEGIQLLMHLGLGGGFRLIDINDVIFNTLGVLLGYGIFMIFTYLYLSITERLGIKPRGLFAYVHEVAARA